MSLVKRIDLLCEEHDTTFAEVERKCELSNGSIRRWDTNTPSIDKLEKIADYFNVSTDYLLGRTDIKSSIEQVLDEDLKFSSSLSYSGFDSLMKWSEDRLFKKHETVAVRSHMAELFLRYKRVIEQLAYAQREWDNSKESFSKFYKEKPNPLTDREIKEIFLKQELEESINSLASWVKNLPSWVSIEEEKHSEYKINDINPLELNAANEIEGASEEDKAHDDAIMDDDNF